MDQGNVLTERQKKLVYRAHYRGTKEMDWLLGKYVEAQVSTMDATEQDLLEAFLKLPDPQLENWILGRDLEVDEVYSGLIEKIQAYHELV